MILCLTKLKKACELHRFVKLRQRYILTKNNTVRLRYVCGYALFLAASAAMAFQNSGLTPFNASQFMTLEVAQLGSEQPAEEIIELASVDDGVTSTSWAIADALQGRISGGIRKASAAMHKTASSPETAEVKVGKGETLAGVLEKAGVSGTDAYQAVKALSAHVDPRSIRAGQVINIAFRSGAEAPEFERLNMALDPLKEVTVHKDKDRFVSDLKEKALRAHVYANHAEIQNSLYGSAERAGIPPQALAELIRLYSRSIDFQRDIQKGDKIEVMYEGMETEDGQYVKYNNIIYANLTIGGKKVPIYRFEGDDGRVDYYDPSGRTTRKTLLKTPVDGARVSSGFGRRFHPVLGYNKMHKGIDFAAPTGTPIYAAGDGTVSFSGRKSGYGNFVKLRHNSELATAYGHMSRIAKGMGSGARVKQGDIIGYVGSTGMATGPHLHYEVLVSNTQVNPRSVDLPTGENLKGKELSRFKRVINSLAAQYVSLTQSMKVAQVPQPSGSSLN